MNTNFENVKPVSSSVSNNSSLSISTLVPVSTAPIEQWIPGSTTAIISDGTGSLTTTTDLVTLVGAAQTALGLHASVKVRNVRAKFTVGAALSQACAVSAICAWMPSALTVPSTAAVLLQSVSQSYQVLLTNAGLGSSSVQHNEIPCYLGTNRMTEQLAPSGLIGNFSPPKFRCFLTVVGTPPTIPANDVGILCTFYYEYLPEKFTGL